MNKFEKILLFITLFVWLNNLVIRMFLSKELMAYRFFEGTRKFKHYNREEIQNPKITIETVCQKWIVKTATQSPGKVILEYKRIVDEDKSDWCCVVILQLADNKVEEEYSNLESTRFILINREVQSRLTNQNTGFLSLLRSDNSLSKKIGYLYAINHGALVIYDVHEDYSTEEELPSTEIVRDYVLVSSKDHVYDPYYYYYSNISITSNSSVLPKGDLGMSDYYQYVRIDADNCNLNNAINLSVIQMLVDQETPNARYFDKRNTTSSTIVLDEGTLATFSTYGSLTYHSAFFVLHHSYDKRNSNLNSLRSYYSQRLMWDVGLNMGFTNPILNKLQPQSNLTENNSNFSSRIISFLTGWLSDSNNLEERMEELAIELYERHFWEIEEVNNIQNWIIDLISTGYQFPSVVPVFKDYKKSSFNTRECSKIITEDIISDGKQTDFQRGKLELFLRMTTSPGLVKLYEDILLTSYTFFWQNETDFLLILDDENEDDHSFGQKSVNEFPYPTVFYEKPNSFYGDYGHSRMQWSMFWADKYATGEYIGFIDTDTLFITLVNEDMLFDGDKPRIWGEFGKPASYWWENIKYNTRQFLKLEEVMRAMTYFPVIIKVKHLAAVRDYISKVHEKSFDDVFCSIACSQREYSQFNIIATYLWYFHREEYVWHMEERMDNKNVDDPEITESINITAEMRIPYPKFSIHYKYIYSIAMKVDRVYGSNTFNVNTRDTLMKEGYCYSGGFNLMPDLCKEFAVNSLQESLFEFEDHTWNWDERCLSEQKAHYARFQVANVKWNLKMINLDYV